MDDPKVERLKRVPIFSRCSKSELRSLAANTDEVTLAAERTLIVEGQSNDTFYIVLDGEVQVIIKGRPSGRIGPGGFFGEMSMLDRGPASATVVTMTPVEALVMSHAQFRDAIQAHDEIALRVITVMAERLRRDHNAGI